MTDQMATSGKPNGSAGTSGDLPRYQQVAGILIDAIATGDHPVGTLLPTEFELCDQFACSRYTVREALRLLFEAGLVSRRRGAGTIVIATKRPPVFNHSLESIDDIIQYARETRYETSKVGRCTIDADLAEHLALPEGEVWIEAFGIRYNAHDPRPVCLMRVFIDPRLEGIQGKLDRPPRALAEIIEEDFDVPIMRIEQRINAINIDGANARLLKVENGSPAIQIVRRYLTEDERVVQVSDNLFPADRVALSMSFERTENGQT